jgi:hypothetical protein
MSEMTQPVINLGDYSRGNYIAGRDLQVSVFPEQLRTQFFTPPLDKYDHTRYTGPIDTPKLLQMAVKEKFLILGGEGYDKPGLARYIARHIRERIPGNPMAVKEWDGSADTQNVLLHLQKENDPGIFILPGISPQNVSYNLSGLYRSARDSGRYLIITTDTPPAKWKPEDDIKRLFWQPADPIYASGTLLNLLIEKLAGAGKSLPAELQEEELKTDGLLLGSLQLNDIAQKLKTPESIEIFVKLLTTTGESMTEPGILKLVENCGNNKRAIQQWFHHSLSSREKLITLGLCLFDGFYDDQFFAAMEELFAKSWHKREASLAVFDYCDLDSLGNYYKLKDLSGEGSIKRVESDLPGQRQRLLETAWNSHRRHILDALPVLVDLVKNSVLPHALNRDLFGTDARRRHLRERISETLCSIGLISVDAIRDVLLSLTAEDDIEVQAIAARAMARMRFYDRDDTLFSTLAHWQKDGETRKRLETLLRNKTVTGRGTYKNPGFYIKAFAALTIGFAALYDPPNQVDDRICDLLTELAKDSANPFVHYRFSHYTLPHIVRFHANRLRDILADMTRYLSLNEPIGASLAIAYRENHVEAAEILDTWFQAAGKNRSPGTAETEITHRDALLAAAVFGYGWIRCNENRGPLTGADCCRRLRSIFEYESSPYVREAAVSAVLRQVIYNIEAFEKHLMIVFPFMDDTDIEQFVAGLVDIHLHQRENMGNGDEYFQWHGSRYPIWTQREAPVTATEKVIRNWLKVSRDKIAQQVAFRFNAAGKLIEFQQEEERILDTFRRERVAPAAHDVIKQYPAQKSPGNTLTIGAVSWLSAPGNRKIRGIIRGLLPEVLYRYNAKGSLFVFFLKKLLENSAGSKNQDIDYWQKRNNEFLEKFSGAGIPHAAAQGAKKNSPILHYLLKKLQKQSDVEIKRNRDILDFVIQRLRRDPDFEMNVIAKKLKQAVFLINNSGVFIFFAACLTSMLLLIIFL